MQGLLTWLGGMLALGVLAFLWGLLMGALTNVNRRLADMGHSLGKLVVMLAALAWTGMAIFGS
jgi:hypothetical protein